MIKTVQKLKFCNRILNTNIPVICVTDFRFLYNNSYQRAGDCHLLLLGDLEELNDRYCSPDIVWAITTWRMRWAGHVARMGERRVV